MRMNLDTNTSFTSSPKAADDRQPLLWVGFAVLFVLPVLITVFNASLTRLVGDDYSYAIIAEREGVWGAVDYWYNAWTGNYSSSFLQTAATLVDPAALGWLMSLTIIVVWLGTWWLAFEVALMLDWERPRLLSFGVGTIVTVTLIDGLPNIYDTLYWAAGGIAHVVPLAGVISFFAFVPFLTRQRPSMLQTAAAVVLTGPYILVVAGFSPASTAHLTVLLVVLIVLCLRFADAQQRRVALPLLIAALLAAGVALLIISAAPGTDIRQSRFPPSPDLLKFVSMTVEYTLVAIIGEFTLIAPASLLVMFTLARSVGYRFHSGDGMFTYRNRWWLFGGVIFTGGLLIAASFSTGAYAMSTFLPHRAFTTPVYTIVVVVAACGYITGVLARRRPRQTGRVLVVIFVLVVLLGPGLVLYSSLRQSVNMLAFNRDWYAIQQDLQAAAERGDAEAQISDFDFDLGQVAVDVPLDNDPDTGTNRDLARYYGLERVTIR
jgi:branched-subunit amino acid transport protein AzlD